MKKSLVYIVSVGLVYLAMIVVMDTFPRSAYSELEQRELATFPEFSRETLFSGNFTEAVSSWFSDTEPFRDRFMKVSMDVKAARRMSFDEEQIVFHAPETDVEEDVANEDTSYVNENAKLAHAGIIISGKGERTRALMAFAGYHCKGKYAEAVNAYANEFASDSVQVYCMPIPSAACFYTPDYAKNWTKPQQPAIDSLNSKLDTKVRRVPLIDVLKRHTAEQIYLRTDHHWAPLGAFYAAREFAKVAGLPFAGIEAYDKRVVRSYVGSMYGYSKDVSVKNAPEDFIYYVPKDSSYRTEYTRYKLNADYKIEGVYPTVEGKLIHYFPDGSSSAYCTYLGSDGRITKITTNVGNGRRLLILKDSFGNPLSAFLLASFEQIYVVDCRYFDKSMKKMVRDNKVTDILFANALSKVTTTDQTGRAYLKMLSK